MTYDEMLEIASNEGIQVIEFDFSDTNMSGYYCDDIVFIDKNSASTIEKKCVLAEEIGHHFTAAAGDITEANDVTKLKIENLGRQWGYNQLISIEDIVYSIIGGCETAADIADHLDITEEFLSEATAYYAKKYGYETIIADHRVLFSDCSIIVHPLLEDIC